MAIIAWNVFASRKQENRRQKNKRLTALARVLKNTEDMISDTGGIPMSQALLIILYRRMARILKEMHLIDQSPKVQTQFESVQTQLKLATDNPPPKSTVMIPSDDAQCAALVKSTKQLINLVRVEFSTGSISSQLYSLEILRLRSLQLSVYAETALRKAQVEIDAERLENAKSLLNRYSDGINNAIYKECPNLKQYTDKIAALIKQLDERRQHAHLQKQKVEAQRAEEIAQLLGQGERKKWN